MSPRTERGLIDCPCSRLDISRFNLLPLQLHFDQKQHWEIKKSSCGREVVGFVRQSSFHPRVRNSAVQHEGILCRFAVTVSGRDERRNECTRILYEPASSFEAQGVSGSKLRRAGIPPLRVINAGVYVSRRAPAASACVYMCVKRATCMLVIPVEYDPGRGNDVRSAQTTILIRARVAMRLASWIRARILSDISVLSFIRSIQMGRGAFDEQGIITRREPRHGFPLSKISI